MIGFLDTGFFTLKILKKINNDFVFLCDDFSKNILSKNDKYILARLKKCVDFLIEQKSKEIYIMDSDIEYYLIDKFHNSNEEFLDIFLERFFSTKNKIFLPSDMLLKTAFKSSRFGKIGIYTKKNNYNNIKSYYQSFYEKKENRSLNKPMLIKYEDNIAYKFLESDIKDSFELKRIIKKQFMKFKHNNIDTIISNNIIYDDALKIFNLKKPTHCTITNIKDEIVNKLQKKEINIEKKFFYTSKVELSRINKLYGEKVNFIFIEFE